MDFLVRLRPGSWLVVLALVALVVVPGLDCRLAQQHAQHGGGSHAVAERDSGAVHDDLASPIIDHCVDHRVHCASPALPPGVVSLTVVALLLAAVTSVLVAAPGPAVSAGGVRGPPRPSMSATGRTLLTLFCIARR
ncbi:MULTISPECIES: hypothetical protein [Nocardia]|uniref:hypothetical protein n=1 Tax=Nocardia TaxID=1817 RepID=UPI0012E307A8|nr:MULTISPECIES: hypothetical protein [Nocardia]